jgi:hypothetical protein
MTQGDFITIEIDQAQLARLDRAFKQFASQADRYMAAAGMEIAKDVILPTTGLMSYPRSDKANMPGRMKMVTFSNGKTGNFRMSYYVRGEGLMEPVHRGNYSSYRIVSGSERYGSQFYVRSGGSSSITIGNRASYAHFLGGKDQVKAMAARGWRKLYDVAKEKVSEINNRYNKWVDKLLRDVGLK